MKKGQVVTTKEIIRVYLNHMRPYKWAAFVVLLSAIIAYITNIVVPLFFKRFFDILANPSVDSVELLTKTLFYILGLMLAEWLFFRITAQTTVWMQSRVMVDLMQSSERYLIRHSYQFFTNNFGGSLVRRVNRLSRSYEDIYDQFLFTLLPIFISSIGILGVLYYRQVWLGVALTAWIIIFLSVNYTFARWKQKYDFARAAKDSETTGVLSDTITNSTNIKLFTGYNHEDSLFKNITEELNKLRIFVWRLNELMDAIQSLMMVGIEFGIMYIAIRLWNKGLITIGDFALIQAYLVTLMMRLWEFGRVIRRTYESLADAAEMVEILNMPHEIQDIKTAIPLNDVQGKIEFNNVTFSYNQTRPVLENFSLIIQPGERIALVGPSGGGKTTVTKILFRLYDIDRGHILIDGQDIARVTQDSLRDNISLVPQEPILFHRSLAENIRYGRREATDEEVLTASRLAHCDEFIKDLPQQYETYVGERGIKLSGGERQRVAIARAILKDAPILILDEATSSLDSESEALIQDALKKLMKGKTTIVIAHRLSTIMQMDRIVVIENGEITDTGTHKELLKKTNTYRRLWKIQAGGFIP